jgi:hypothetical protein
MIEFEWQLKISDLSRKNRTLATFDMYNDAVSGNANGFFVSKLGIKMKELMIKRYS